MASMPTPYPPVVHAETIPETLQEQSVRIATQFDISTSTFANLIYSESRWNPDATSTTHDRGIVQINSDSHPEVSDECAFDPECAMSWAAQRIKDGHLDEWTAGNCYAYVKTKIKDLPKMVDIKPNSPAKAGGVAIFNYKGTKHIAYIKSFDGSVLNLTEANYVPALISSRVISIHDKNLVGFWSAEAD